MALAVAEPKKFQLQGTKLRRLADLRLPEKFPDLEELDLRSTHFLCGAGIPSLLKTFRQQT
jgi:hypothetical protein